MDDLYDQIYSVIGAAFPDKSELLDPYNTSNNNQLNLKDGFGVEIGPVTDTEQLPTYAMLFSRVINVTFTKINIASDKNSGDRKTKEKELLAEGITLISAFKNGLTKATDVAFGGDDGVEYVFNERLDYLRLKMNFGVSYKREVSTCH